MWRDPSASRGPLANPQLHDCHATIFELRAEFQNGKCTIPSCFSGQVLSCLGFCVFFNVFRSRSLQNRPGTCLNASGTCFASNLHMEMGKIIRKSIRSEHFGILQFWEFFCQPFGENTFSKKRTPKRKMKSLKNSKFC